MAAVVALGAAAAAFTLGGARGSEAATAMPPCAHPHARVSPPAGLRAFPLPTGSVLDASRQRYGYTVISGYVPGAINPGRDFLVSRLPPAGYRLGTGDSEANEAEAEFAGHSVRGKFKLRAIFGCPGAMTLQIAVRSAHG